MANYFDKYDSAAPESNYFDKYDEVGSGGLSEIPGAELDQAPPLASAHKPWRPFTRPEAGFGGDTQNALGGRPDDGTSVDRIAEFGIDSAIDLTTGTINLVRSGVGLADMATGNAVGAALDAIGYRPEEAVKALADQYSPSRKAGNREVEIAEGFWGNVGALVDNPRVAFGTIVQSAPLSLGGAAIARWTGTRLLGSALASRGIAPGTAAATQFAKEFFGNAGIRGLLVAAGAGAEGATSAGLLQEEQRGGGKGWFESVIPSLMTGASTAAISMLSSKIPGFKDAEEMVAAAGRGLAGKTSVLAAGKEIGKTMFKEGWLEELPQEISEAIWENLAFNRPWDRGLDKAAAAGAITGMAQGGGMALGAKMLDAATGETAAPNIPPPQAPSPPKEQALTALLQATTPEEAAAVLSPLSEEDRNWILGQVQETPLQETPAEVAQETFPAPAISDQEAQDFGYQALREMQAANAKPVDLAADLAPVEQNMPGYPPASDSLPIPVQKALRQEALAQAKAENPELLGKANNAPALKGKQEAIFRVKVAEYLANQSDARPDINPPELAQNEQSAELISGAETAPVAAPVIPTKIYKSERGANKVLAGLKLGDGYSVFPVEGGFQIQTVPVEQRAATGQAEAAPIGATETPTQYPAIENPKNQPLNHILDRKSIRDARLNQIADPEDRADFGAELTDHLLGDYGATSYQDAYAVIRRLDKENIPASVVMMDGGNMGAVNAKHGNIHEQADPDIRAVWGEILAKEIRKAGGVLARNKGDEMMAVLPNHSQQEAEALMAGIDKKIRVKRDEMGYAESVNPKNGLPVGALHVNYGAAEHVPGKIKETITAADSRQAEQKYLENLAKAEEKGLVYSQKEGRYVARELEPEARVAAESESGRDSAEAAGRSENSRGQEETDGTSGESKEADQITPQSLIALPTREALQGKLQELFGMSYGKMEDAKYGNKAVALADDYMADLEYAAWHRDETDLTAVFNNLRNDPRTAKLGKKSALYRNLFPAAEVSDKPAVEETAQPKADVPPVSAQTVPEPSTPAAPAAVKPASEMTAAELMREAANRLEATNAPPDLSTENDKASDKPTPGATDKASPSVTTGGVSKEPWQMTAAEWDTARENVKPEVAQSNFTKASGSQAVARNKTLNDLLYGVTDEASQKIKAAAKGEITLTAEELDRHTTRLQDRVTHRDVIEKAISEGKTIAPEVLADYPDLTQTPTPQKDKGGEGPLFSKGAPPYQDTPEGGLVITDFDAIPWGKVNQYMKSKGYDIRGADDARRMFEKANKWQGGIDGTHADAIRSVIRARQKSAETRSNEANKIITAAVREFGTTTDPKEAGYLLPDGRMLDFSGKRDGGSPGQRSYDHREINRAYEPEGDDHSSAMFEFASKTGAVRMDYNNRGYLNVDIYSHPTKKQVAVLKSLISQDTEVNLDVSSATGSVIETYEGRGQQARAKIEGVIRRNFPDVASDKLFSTGQPTGNTVSQVRKELSTILSAKALFNKARLEVVQSVSQLPWVGGNSAQTKSPGDSSAGDTKLFSDFIQGNPASDKFLRLLNTPGQGSAQSGWDSDARSLEISSQRVLADPKILRNLLDRGTIDIQVFGPLAVEGAAAVPGSGRGKGSQSLQTASDGVSRDIEMFSNLLGSEAYRQKGMSGVGVPTQLFVQARMAAYIGDGKIIDAIIKAVPVNVVDMLGWKKSSADMSSQDMAMFKESFLSSEIENNVALLVDALTDNIGHAASVVGGVFSDTGNVPQGGGIRNSNGTVAGAFFDGKVWLVADGIKPGEAASIWKHEMGHSIMRTDPVFIKRYDSLLSEFEALRGSDPRVETAFSRVPSDTPAHLQAEEALAYAVQAEANVKPGKGLGEKARFLIKKIVAHIRAWLNTHGFKVKLTTDDILAMIDQGIKRDIRRSEQGAADQSEDVRGMVPAFAKQFGISIEEAQRQYDDLQKASSLEHLVDSLPGSASVLGYLRDSDAFKEHGVGGFDVPSRLIVGQAVGQMVDNRKILNAVIESIPVDMVGILRAKKLSAKVLLKDMTMLKDLFAGNSNDSIPLSVDESTRLADIIASATAENLPMLSDLGREPSNRYAAPEAMGVDRGQRFGVAGHRAESLLPAWNFGRESLEITSTSRADKDGHGASPVEFKLKYHPTGGASTLNQFSPHTADIRYSKDTGPLFSKTKTEREDTAAQIVAEMGKRGLFRKKKGGRFILPPENFAQRLQRKMQKAANRIDVIQAAVVAQGGTVTEATNMSKAIEQYPGKVAAGLLKFGNDEIEPMMQRIVAAFTSLDEVGLLAYAEHAAERNAAMAILNPDRFPNDGTPGRSGSGMTDSEAQVIISQAKAQPNAAELFALTAELRRISRDRLKMLVAGGEMTQDHADAYLKKYPNYVPLKGFEEIDEDGVPQGKGKGLSTGGKIDFRAMGRSSRAGQIAQNIFADYENAVMLSEKAEVAKVVAAFVEANPDAANWTIGEPARKPMIQRRQKVVHQVLVDGVPVGEFNDKEDAEFYRDTLAQRGGMVTVESHKLANESVIARPSMFNENAEIRFIKDGQPVRIQITDPGFVRAYNQLWHPGVSDGLRWLNTYNGLLRQAYTQKNPAWAVMNILRDAQSVIPYVTGEQGVAIAAKTPFNMPMAFMATWNFHHNKPAGPVMDRIIKMYLEEGGYTGFSYVGDIEAQTIKLQGMIARYTPWSEVGADLRRGEVKKASRGAVEKIMNTRMFAWIEAMNTTFENTTRLAVFKSAIDAGVSPQDAALLAKNASTNFNQRGEWGPNINAAYLFANAGVQSTRNVGHSLFFSKHKGQVWALMGGLFSLGLMAGLVSDDDDDLVDDQTRQRSLVGKFGDTIIMIPMAYGYGAFAGLGQLFAQFLKHPEKREKIAVAMADLSAAHFSPIGNPFGDELKASGLVNILPTFAKPWFNTAANVSPFNGPMYPESSFDKNRPDSEKMWRSTKGTGYASVAQYVNRLTGGDEITEGWASVSPETVKLHVNTMTGGVGRLLTDMVSLAVTDNREAKNIPVVKNLYRKIDTDNYTQRFYRQAEKAESSFLVFKKYLQQEGDSAEKYQAQESAMIDMGNLVSEYRSRLSKLRDYEDQINGDTSLSGGDKKTFLAEIDKSRIEITTLFNNTLKELSKKGK